MALNLALAAVATLLIVYIARQFIAPMPLPVGGRRAATAGSAAVTDPPRPPASAYNVVAARNLFSPTRTEAPTSGAVATGYRVGDRILGGTVQAIKVDGVTIDAPGGAMDVRLHDPGKPRATPAAVSAPPQPSVAPTLPGVIPPTATTPVPPTVAQPPAQPSQPPVMPGQPPMVGVPGQPTIGTPPVIPGRRPLPPNLLRRLPPGMGDAPQQ
ncbi:MAG: hypothetical protein AUG55_00530 [Candidatus Rokubacteria bacterium 13_1_20CM_4_70_13]|nr:MAG: hypothetical protein AUG55_00530 [Candidatus Rokubacteria bacterium 13_1_20CM_4_70_13]